jgi:TusA-related sulfurtransferase
VASSEQAGLAQKSEDGNSLPNRDALLVFHTDAAKSESTCAVLTPAIKSKLREMQSGQVLEVRVDDPEARGDIEAWCRLSGNLLLGMNESEGQELQFFVQKK